MQPRRTTREENRNDSSESLFPAMASETFRSASNPPPSRVEAPAKSGEERVSIFWRIFGGTTLSIVALAVLTAYQSISGSIQELRTGMLQANEARAEMVKKEEYQTSRTKLSDRMQEIQKDITTLQTPINQMRDRLVNLEEQTKTLAAERKDMHELQVTIKERQTQFEQRLNNGTVTQKDVQTLHAALTGLQEKSAVRDQQLKQMEDERKDLMKEIQALRERLAKVEAAKDAATPRSNPPSKPMKDADETDNPR